jgi:hypothetical protein
VTFIKCAKCGREEPAFDYAHICGPVKIKSEINQRAIELYQQATAFAYESIGKEHANTAYFQGAVAGKFAELIVQECAELAACNAHVSGFTLGDLIKKHFGIDHE